MSRLYRIDKHIIIGWLLIVCFLFPLLSACVSAPTSSDTPATVSATSQTGSGGAAPGATTGASPTSTSGSAVPLNVTILYASAQITLVDAKQATAFADDTSAPTTGALRLDIKENNPTANSAGYDYTSIARLLLPGGTDVAPVNAQVTSGPGASISRTNWIDFPVPMSTQISQVSLQLGKDTDAQEVIPLTANADVSKYATKTSSPNVKMTYGKIDWTVTTATSELSYGGVQAAKGMMFVVVELNADNKGSSSGGGDLVGVRLKAGTTTSPAQEFLNSVAADQTNVKSTVSFIMPQGSTSFTLIFLPSNAYGITTQSSVDFQIA